ncbi:hypothetical protein BC938DRAFT_473849 [Jimgerdemannia flammicorona]|uniref:Protein Zds1 C-terminal domain-containing protein n=1 Tax=Jimgerdemannia flammicorona TaxID=994334 RepID=A0A433Q3C8_9FUNG|nr:hypothetical protein BC938DRAFT_473849 [Jimgerdemannia flammicorona]
MNHNSSPDDQSGIIVPRDQGRPILRRSARTKIRRNSVDDGTPPEPGESRRWSTAQGQHRRSQSHDVSEKLPMSTSPPKSKPTPLTEEFPAPPPRGSVVPPGGVTLRDAPVVEPTDTTVTSTMDIGVTAADIDATAEITSTDLLVNLPKENTVVKPFVSRLREPDREVISLTPKKELLPEQELAEMKEGLPESPRRVVPSPRSSSLITIAGDGKGKTIMTIPGSGATTILPGSPSPMSSASTPAAGLSRKSTWSWLFSSEDKEKLKKARTDVAGSLTIKADTQPSTLKPVSKDFVPPKSPKDSETASGMSVDTPSGKKSFGLSSLFSRSSKVPATSRPSPDSAVANTSTIATTASPETAMAKKPKYSNYNRLPIHVERAIYRLSHIKLANPRRPLHHQVLISNLMFWYLSVINQQGQNGGAAARQQQSRSPQDQGSKKKGNKNPQGDKKRRKSEGIQKKNKPSNGQLRPRGSETAIRAPQYDVQQHIIAQQYRANQAQQQQQQQMGSAPNIYPAQDSRYPLIQPAGPTSYANLNSVAESIPVNPPSSQDEYESSVNDIDSNYDDEDDEYDSSMIGNRNDTGVPYSDDEKFDQTSYKPQPPRFVGTAVMNDGYSSDGSEGGDETSSSSQNPASAARLSLELSELIDTEMSSFGDDLLNSFGLTSSTGETKTGSKVASGSRTTVNAPAASAIGLGKTNGNANTNGRGSHLQPPALDIKNPRRPRSPNPSLGRTKNPVHPITTTDSEADDEDDVPLAVFARTH